MVEFNKYSVYKNTSKDNFYRDYYNPINIDYDDSDIFLIVTSDFNQKPGNLANYLYGTPRLGWICSYFNRNQIADPIFDLREGMIIRVPTKSRLLSYF